MDDIRMAVLITSRRCGDPSSDRGDGPKHLLIAPGLPADRRGAAVYF